MSKLTHFGYQKIDEREKTEKVAEVFNHVARHYDLMNDLMSCGLHRLWKAFAVSQASIREGYKVLDVDGRSHVVFCETGREKPRSLADGYQ